MSFELCHVSILVLSGSFFLEVYCLLDFADLYVFFDFLYQESYSYNFKVDLPDSHHWFTDLYLLFCNCHSFQKLLNKFWKIFCFKIDVTADERNKFIAISMYYQISNAVYLFWLYLILCMHRIFAVEIFTVFILIILILLFVFTWKIVVPYFRMYVSVKFPCIISFRSFGIFRFTLCCKFYYFACGC